MQNQRPGPSRLFAVTQFRERDHDGLTAAEYIMRRYEEGEFGYMADRADVLFFFDEGHRDEFATRFGGVKLTLVKKATKPDLRKVIAGLGRSGVRS